MSERRRRTSPAEQYRRLFVSAQAPVLEAFLAELPELTPDDLLDVIETDRTERWRRGERVLAERYLNDFPVIRDDHEAALVIVYGEYYLRKEFGEGPSLMEFIARFPNFARRLRDQVMWHEAIELGTSLNTIGTPEIPGLVVGELLGQGGMCSVYQSVDEQTGETVAVKLLDREHLHHPVRVARFRREVGSLMRLRHPHIVLAHRTGDVSGIPYLVMELCEGGTLAKYLAGKPLPRNDVVRVMSAISAAVQYAHSEGVIHRDLKPGNILLCAEADAQGFECAIRSEGHSWVPKVSDFGLAKCESGADSSITATRETLGTPCYMAPELTTGARDADVRTDVYGLGAILYEMLTGRPPFLAATPLEVVRMVREEIPIPPKELNPSVPSKLNDLCVQCLEKEPDDRISTAERLSAALRV